MALNILHYPQDEAQIWAYMGWSQANQTTYLLSRPHLSGWSLALPVKDQDYFKLNYESKKT